MMNALRQIANTTGCSFIVDNNLTLSGTKILKVNDGSHSAKQSAILAIKSVIQQLQPGNTNANLPSVMMPINSVHQSFED